ncbi:hypothetical protein MMC25_005095 [Agyrium rufum]|nr:hypothetical protein [Agyrium rufum]
MNGDDEEDIRKREKENYDVFRECFTTAVFERNLSAKKPKTARRRSRRVKSTPTSEDVDNEHTAEGSNEELSEFLDFLATELFDSLIPELRTISYSILQRSPSLADRYSSTSTTTLPSLETLLPSLPPTVQDSIQTYSLLPPQTSFDTLLTSVLAAYLSQITAPPPIYRQTKPPACEICERDWIPLTYHHLVPKEVADKAIKRGWCEEWEREKVAWLCRACHNFVHGLAGNEELAREWASTELLLGREDVQAWRGWVGRGILELYVEAANRHISAHIRNQSVQRISRAEVDLLVCTALDSSDLDLHFKFAWYDAVLSSDLFNSFWLSVKLQHKLPDSAVQPYLPDTSLTTYDAPSSPELEPNHLAPVPTKPTGPRQRATLRTSKSKSSTPAVIMALNQHTASAVAEQRNGSHQSELSETASVIASPTSRFTPPPTAIITPGISYYAPVDDHAAGHDTDISDIIGYDPTLSKVVAKAHTGDPDDTTYGSAKKRRKNALGSSPATGSGLRGGARKKTKNPSKAGTGVGKKDTRALTRPAKIRKGTPKKLSKGVSIARMTARSSLSMEEGEGSTGAAGNAADGQEIDLHVEDEDDEHAGHNLMEDDFESTDVPDSFHVAKKANEKSPSPTPSDVQGGENLKAKAREAPAPLGLKGLVAAEKEGRLRFGEDKALGNPAGRLGLL